MEGITNLADKVIDRNEPLRVLIYGEAGCGKTTLAGTFPKPMLVLDFDQKLKPLYGKGDISVKSYIPAAPSDCSKVFLEFKRDWKGLKKNCPFKTVVIDSLTAMDIVVLRACVIAGGKDAEKMPEIQHYGDHGNWFSYFFKYSLSDVQMLGVNVVVTAHELYNISKESGVHSVQPLVTGQKLPNKVPAFFEDVWHMETKGGTNETIKRKLYFRKSNKAMATTTILSGEAIEEPTYEKIIGTVKGK